MYEIMPHHCLIHELLPAKPILEARLVAPHARGGKKYRLHDP